MITRGAAPAPPRSLRKKRSAAQRSRFGCTRISMVTPFLVHSPPEIVLNAVHLEKDLIQVPFRTDARPTLSKLRSIKSTELSTPFPDGFIRHAHAAHSHHLFDIAIAQRETKIQPDTVLHNFDGKTMTTIPLSSCSPPQLLTHAKLTMPSAPRSRRSSKPTQEDSSTESFKARSRWSGSSPANLHRHRTLPWPANWGAERSSLASNASLGWPQAPLDSHSFFPLMLANLRACSATRRTYLTHTKLMPLSCREHGPPGIRTADSVRSWLYIGADMSNRRSIHLLIRAPAHSSPFSPSPASLSPARNSRSGPVEKRSNSNA